MDLNKEPLTMMVNRRSSFKGKKLLDTACEHCGYRNHLSKDCYRIIGYPNDFKRKRKQGQRDSNTGYRGQSTAYGTENGHRSNNFSHNYHVDSGIKSHANYAGQSMAYGTENGHRSNNFSHNYHVDFGIKSHANYAATEEHGHGLTLTEEEYNHVKNLRHNNSSQSAGDGTECKANLAGNVSLTSNVYECGWIIDSDATHHITSSKDFLAELSYLGD
ncbi:hypothetical protein H5410_031559 [Solanum commersonii]|uniref:CCHC-type domain-containing protein n=1 Tax=Solanum commersonii TaxID=4109 RepID=A0A9J5YJI7_SOLCO|nr:hypothetical protein H5410_031559 [Solanum commersonii]